MPIRGPKINAHGITSPDGEVWRKATDEEVVGGLHPHEAVWQKPLTPEDPATGTVMTNRPL
jgi:hypothetical protein